MENSNHKIEFYKFKNPGESIEGVIKGYYKTLHGGAVKLEIAENEYIYVGINLTGLKDVFKQAVQLHKIVFNKTVVSILFKNEVPLIKDKTKTFMHFVLSGYTEKENINTFFRFSTEEYESIDEMEFLNLLD